MSLLLALLLTAVTVVPKGVILVRGATPSASDASTPVPEEGRVVASRYRNTYFGLSYPIPAGWSKQPAGPPPSDGGGYVLAQFAVPKANVLLSAQDLFFSASRLDLPPQYEVESGPQEVTLGGRTFHRAAYWSPRSGFHWRILSTEARCHRLTFTFTGTDVAVMDAAEQAMRGVSMPASGNAPRCLANYARGENVLARTEPSFTAHRYNTIPVRVIVGADGRVKHVHLLSAFPEQSQAILAALRSWRFKPYRVEGRAVPIETGLVFGMPRSGMGVSGR